MRDVARAKQSARQWSRTSSATRRSARYIKQLLARRLHRPLQAVHDRAVPRSLCDRAAAPADVAGVQGGGRRHPRRARIALHRRIARLVRRGCVGAWPAWRRCAPTCSMRRPARSCKAESDDTFAFTLNFVNGGMATMIASFAATPTRGARIVVMGDEGTLIAEQAGPNPTDDGVVIASRKGAPFARARDAAAVRRSRRTRAIIG